MKQLVMAILKSREMKTNSILPEGYSYKMFKGTEKDIEDWKKIIGEEPAPKDGVDSCYKLMILDYPDVDLMNDIYFVEDEKGERVATFTTITHTDGTGYVHMVKSMGFLRGKGLGKKMAHKTVEIFKERNIDTIVLTTDDFRLGAIKTYLDAGYKPVLMEDAESDVKARWQKILELLLFDTEFIELEELKCEHID